MSEEENPKQAEDAVEVKVEAAKKTAASLVSSILSLKEKQPKVFFGIAGGIAGLIILLAVSGGGGSNTVSGPVIKDLAIGQKYVLKSANAYDPSATVRLVSVPGSTAAYDDTEEADRTGACQHMPQGTPVTVLQLQDAYGKKNIFAEVEMEDGECKGKTGWALSIDVQ